MKKKIVMALLVMAMSVSVFTGCGNRIEGDGKVQAAMADSVDGQEEKEDIQESETVESAETEESEDSSLSEADTEPSEGSVESSVTGDSDTTTSAQANESNSTATNTQTETQANSSNSTATGTQISTRANGTSEVDSASSGTMPEFIEYLNKQRAALGLSPLSISSELTAEAQRRAEEVVSNFSHDGRGNYLEALYSGGSANTEDIYSAWFNSPAHQATMLNPNAANAGVAFVEIDGLYYVVLVEKTETPVMSAQEWNDYKDEAVESGAMDYYEVEDEGSISGVYIEGEGGILSEDDPLYEDLAGLFWGE